MVVSCKVKGSGSFSFLFGNADCPLPVVISRSNKAGHKKLKADLIPFGSERKSCIDRIAAVGPEAFAQEMADKRIMVYKR